MTPDCDAATLATRPENQSHSHTIKLFYLCYSLSICYYVLPSFLFCRNYIILPININITYYCLFVMTVLLVQWLASQLHTQESQVQISLNPDSIVKIFSCFFFKMYILYCNVQYCIVLYLYCVVLHYTLLYFTVLYCICTLLYCTVLYCTGLVCTILNSNVLYCNVWYCTLLYCNVL